MATGASTRKDDKSTQNYAALGIGFVCLIIGVPLWWKTTEVYRYQLPYSDIAGLSELKIKYAVDIQVIQCSLDLTDLSTLSGTIKNLLDHQLSNDINSYYRLVVKECGGEEKKIIQSSTKVEELDQKLSEKERDNKNSYTVVLLSSDSRIKLVKSYVGNNRIVVIKVKTKDIGEISRNISDVIKDTVVRESAVLKGYHAGKGAINLKPDKDSMRSFRSNPGYDITLSLVNPQPDILDVQWDVEAGMQAYLDPLLKKLEKFADIRVKSQVLFFTGLTTRPQKDSISKEFYYKTQDLPHLINPLESKLISPATTNPGVNFLLYIPSRDQSPLYLRDIDDKNLKTNSFLSPRWGGLYVYNIQSPENGTTLPKKVHVDMKNVMEVFLSQFRLLLNLHGQISKTDTQRAKSNDQNAVITEWELDAWLRLRCVENLATTATSLQSLAQLLDKIGNIVIRDEIGLEVEEALSTLKQSHRDLLDGKLEEAFLKSKDALIHSEKAFFDPSLLELLYFPEDQKFAIYIPLFLPISIPVLSSLYKAFKWIKEQRKEKKE